MAERQYRIHPAIGIARVGNAIRRDDDNDFYFVGPEFPDVAANIDPLSGTQGTFKTTADGRVRPQAARFRIFEYEKQADGKFHPIGEVKVSDVSRTVTINWTVHLANRKASFCEFHGQAGAEDRPLFFSSYTNTDQTLVPRNLDIGTLANRKRLLELDPGPKSIAGGATTVAHFPIDRDLVQPKDGETKLKIKTLGEMRSDRDGHLVVIGGMGQSDFDPGVKNPAPLHNFANNDGWFDDMSDGPVTATLTINGTNQPVAGAWVLVGPPDFAPAIRSYRSMYDSLMDEWVRGMDPAADDGLFAGPLAHIAAMRADWKKNGTIKEFKPSFTRDIAPILTSIARVQRVHEYVVGDPQNPQGGGHVASYHGTLTLLNFPNLGGEGSLQASRRALFDRMRDPNSLPPHKIEPALMPSALGDYYEDANGRGDKTDPAYLHSVSALQYALLSAWNAGNFNEDWGKIPPAAPAITPTGLDRAALENASGGAFYPGMEVSWLFVKKEVWQQPFRIAAGRKVGSIPVPGGNRHDLVIEAGTFSQQMALPWQADFRACTAESVTDDSLPGKSRRVAWWPTNRPDEVFPESTPNARQPWARHADGTSFGVKAMVEMWWTLGFVAETTPAGAPTDFYEVEFNVGPTAGPVVAAADSTSGQVV
jgi:L-Lysine epsilon oxidase N-terminal/L-lysine epsilon oxidase C-terminal domain